jgi:aminopeptidase N
MLLEQSDPLSSTRTPVVWNQRLTVAYGNGDTLRSVSVHLRDAQVSNRQRARRSAPDFLLPGADGVSYGHFVLDEASRKQLLTQLPAIPNPIARSAAWIAMWESVLYSELAPEEFIALALRALPRESDELIMQYVLGLLDAAYWRLRTPAERAASATEVESTLWGEAVRPGTTARKRAFFDTYVSVAITDAGVSRLRRIFLGQEPGPGIPVSEEQFITLAKELALRGVPDIDRLLQLQLVRLTNPDRRARFAFVMPALSGESVERDSVFASFANVENRRREAWVLEAQAALMHPLRDDREKRITRSLELAEEIQRTGDIFFPQRWLSATLSSQQSPVAAGMVRDFLARAGPSYPARLRAKILQAADPLFRAERIVGGR